MSAPGNTAKLGTTHSIIQTTQSSSSLVGSEAIYIQFISQHTTESAHLPTIPVGECLYFSHKITTYCQYNPRLIHFSVFLLNK